LEKEARRLGFENIHTIWTDLEEPGGTTLGNASMDAVIASNILFQIEHKEYFLQEVFRILKYGGKALIVDWNDSFGGIGPQSEAVVRRTVAHSLAEKAGFLFEKDVDAGSHHYGMIFRKPRQRS
jgi:ubiquinone/menaquinone biosynthesis C-methylase UbiE